MPTVVKNIKDYKGAHKLSGPNAFSVGRYLLHLDEAARLATLDRIFHYRPSWMHDVAMAYKKHANVHQTEVQRAVIVSQLHFDDMERLRSHNIAPTKRNCGPECEPLLMLDADGVLYDSTLML